jgi:ubiquinone/menaquinone biosynthesis C-methylase UbiE
MMHQANAQYNVAKPQSLAVRIAGYQRRRMFAAFLAESGVSPGETVLDVGVTSDQSYDHSNYLEAWYPHKDRVTAVGLDDASFLQTVFPGVRFVRADGRDLPFADGAYDHVHSSAVIEHVGNRAQQAGLLRELWRVARRSVFVTTPNRGFPVEFHTVLPLLHWLPPAAFRAVLRRLGYGFFAEENNLNLMMRNDLCRAAQLAGMRHVTVKSVSLAGWPSNLLLVARKAPEDATATGIRET